MKDPTGCVCVGARNKVVTGLLKRTLPRHARHGDYVNSLCRNNAAKTTGFDADFPAGDYISCHFRIHRDDVATTIPFAISSAICGLQAVLSAHPSRRSASSGGD